MEDILSFFLFSPVLVLTRRIRWILFASFRQFLRNYGEEEVVIQLFHTWREGVLIKLLRIEI